MGDEKMMRDNEFSGLRVCLRRGRVVLCFALLTACAGAPVGWGGKYEVVAENDRSITIRYDNVTESFEDIFRVARSHCEKFGKDAVPSEAVSTDAGGLIRTHYFKCE
jgi:hypothetical protein